MYTKQDALNCVLRARADSLDRQRVTEQYRPGDDYEPEIPSDEPPRCDCGDAFCHGCGDQEGMF